jgi:hypothetical protein
MPGRLRVDQGSGGLREPDPIQDFGTGSRQSIWDQTGATDLGRADAMEQFKFDPVFATRQTMRGLGHDNANSPFLQRVIREMGEFGNLPNLFALRSPVGADQADLTNPQTYVDFAQGYLGDMTGLAGGRNPGEGSGLMGFRELGGLLGEAGQWAGDMASTSIGQTQFGNIIADMLLNPETTAEDEAGAIMSLINMAAPTAMAPVQRSLFARQVQNFYQDYQDRLWDTGAEYNAGDFFNYFMDAAADFLAWQFGG